MNKVQGASNEYPQRMHVLMEKYGRLYLVKAVRDFGISWVSSRIFEPAHDKKLYESLCDQRRIRSACAFVQSDQSLTVFSTSLGKTFFFFFFCLAFYLKRNYFVLIDHILSEIICLFCFCVLFSNMYPKLNLSPKIGLSCAISIVKLFCFWILS